MLEHYIGILVCYSVSRAGVKAEDDAMHTIDTYSQHAQWILNKIEKIFNGTFTGSKSMIQGFTIYFV